MKTVKTMVPGKGVVERRARYERPTALRTTPTANENRPYIRVVPETGELEWSDGKNIRRRGGEPVKR